MKGRAGVLYTLPLMLWSCIFFIIPIIIVFIYSFLAKGLYGGVVWQFSLKAFSALFSWSFFRVSLVTLLIAVLSTILTLLIALPVSYYLARTKNNTLLLALVVIPFWVNLLLRVYAWIAILGREGFLNHLMTFLGYRGEPVQFLFNFWAVVIVHVYTYLPYMILPLYSNIEKFDFGLLEAARDLGATHMGSLVRVMLPNIKGGIVTAILFAFIPTMGSYAIPDLVGSTNSHMLGNSIAYNIRTANNWPLASAISLVLTLISALGIMIYFFLNRKPARHKVREAP
ncbi:MAG: ABC transporter permease [Spirochaetales bacterium]|jgi:spermidine/putrescine transport system permease protein|nr:ABC transporter permease [Spirochaetales bacterium]